MLLNRSYTKVLPYVYPEWITDSINKNKLIPYEKYLLREMKNENQNSLFNVTQPKSSLISAVPPPLPPSTTTNSLKSNIKISNGIKSARDDPNFINKYFRSSRLHFLGTFKCNLKRKLKTENKLNKNKEIGDDISSSSYNNNIYNEEIHKVYCHIDMDCYFVSVALLKHPEYRNKPTVVSTSPNGYK